VHQEVIGSDRQLRQIDMHIATATMDVACRLLSIRSKAKLLVLHQLRTSQVQQPGQEASLHLVFRLSKPPALHHILL
jgi:hypothetical protein